jgi:hypothetical protein
MVFGEFEIIKNMTFSEILEMMDNVSDKAVLSNYIYLLWCIALVWGNVDNDPLCLK